MEEEVLSSSSSNHNFFCGKSNKHSPRRDAKNNFCTVLVKKYKASPKNQHHTSLKVSFSEENSSVAMFHDKSESLSSSRSLEKRRKVHHRFDDNIGSEEKKGQRYHGQSQQQRRSTRSSHSSRSSLSSTDCKQTEPDNNGTKGGRSTEAIYLKVYFHDYLVIT